MQIFVKFKLFLSLTVQYQHVTSQKHLPNCLGITCTFTKGALEDPKRKNKHYPYLFPKNPNPKRIPLSITKLSCNSPWELHTVFFLQKHKKAKASPLSPTLLAPFSAFISFEGAHSSMLSSTVWHKTPQVFTTPQKNTQFFSIVYCKYWRYIII